MLKKQETGRSMVEMLGVLAIIGVLSVGGIAGYTSAMNKHRANELLNEASKRAVVIVPQIMAGNTPSITEFTNNDFGYGTFVSTVYGENGTAEWTSTDKKFTLSITGVSEAVCNQMKNAQGGVIKGFSPETCASGNGNNIKLTYFNDMSVDGGSSDNIDTDPTCAGVTCNTANGEVCDNGYCVKACGNNCQWCYYDSEFEQQCESSEGCKKNSDCLGKSVNGTVCDAGDCYCVISAEPDSNSNVNTAYWTNFTGVCALLSIDEKSRKYSDYGMNWWTAKNFCKAKGSNLVSISETCNESISSGCATTSRYYWLSDCSGTDCVNSRYGFAWFNGYVNGGRSRNGGEGNTFPALCE